jgi:hypothetical protein
MNTPAYLASSLVTQDDHKITKKLPNITKSSPKSHQVKKGQNIFNKSQFESPRHLQQTTFETLKYLRQIMLI